MFRLRLRYIEEANNSARWDRDERSQSRSSSILARFPNLRRCNTEGPFDRSRGFSFLQYTSGHLFYMFRLRLRYIEEANNRALWDRDERSQLRSSELLS
jgi:hypothetical protein